jgi:hypothetical protein
METLFLVVEAVLWLVEIVATGADVYSWIKGKQNRVLRKEARTAGAVVPPRDRWNRRVIGLTALVAVVTLLLILWRS